MEKASYAKHTVMEKWSRLCQMKIDTRGTTRLKSDISFGILNEIQHQRLGNRQIDKPYLQAHLWIAEYSHQQQKGYGDKKANINTIVSLITDHHQPLPRLNS